MSSAAGASVGCDGAFGAAESGVAGVAAGTVASTTVGVTSAVAAGVGVGVAAGVAAAGAGVAASSIAGLAFSVLVCNVEADVVSESVDGGLGEPEPLALDVLREIPSAETYTGKSSERNESSDWLELSMADDEIALREPPPLPPLLMRTRSSLDSGTSDLARMRGVSSPLLVRISSLARRRRSMTVARYLKNLSEQRGESESQTMRLR